MKKALGTAIYFIIAGVLVGVGVRFAEHTIPAPEMRIIVCAAGKDDTLETCKPLADLIGKKGT